jgi:hypothetical protein
MKNYKNHGTKPRWGVYEQGRIIQTDMMGWKTGRKSKMFAVRG